MRRTAILRSNHESRRAYAHAGMPPWFRLAFLSTLFLLTLLISARTSAEPSAEDKEYQIKAAFLYNFIKYVDWPPAAEKSANAPIHITVLGDSARLESIFKAVVGGRGANGRPVVVRFARSLEALQPADVLFVPKWEDSLADAAVERLKGRPILTVGESDRFRDSEGMIVFIIESKQVRFQINMAAVEKAGLKISSQLQKLAKKEGR